MLAGNPDLSRTRKRKGAALALAALFCATAQAGAQQQIPRTPAPPGAHVYFISPADGETVASPVLVRFGLSGMGVAPAGVPLANTGHHHLLIDAELTNPDAAIPADAHHRHFGGGQTEASIELAPGEHVLQLVLGDQNHVPHEPPVVSDRIHILVK